MNESVVHDTVPRNAKLSDHESTMKGMQVSAHVRTVIQHKNAGKGLTDDPGISSEILANHNLEGHEEDASGLEDLFQH